MEKQFKKYGIRSFRIVLKRMNLKDFPKMQVPVTAQNDFAPRKQFKECKVVLSRFETEEIIRKLQNADRKGK